MSALGHKRTFQPVSRMSALPPKADIMQRALILILEGQGIAGAGLGLLIGASFLSAASLLGGDVLFENEQDLGHRGPVFCHLRWQASHQS